MAIIHEIGPMGKGGRSTRALSIQRLLDIKGLAAVDLGSKEGYNAFDLVECGASRVVGLEVRDSFIQEAEEARRQLGYDSVSFQKADVRQVDELGLGRFDLCLCSGLLYHMQNPYNLLKRIRNICRYLVLETHVAPTLPAYFLAGRKYRNHLQLRTRTVMLDGEAFAGRLNVFPLTQDMKTTSGSIASHTTFWPTLSSLEKALRLAGFEMDACYFGTVPKGRPQILVDHGLRRTKVFLVARVREPDASIAAGPSLIGGCPELLPS